MSDKREWTAERHAAAWDRCNRATSGPWRWWTSNSHRRLTADGCQEGGVAYGTKHKDGCGDIVIGEHDMAFIEEARVDLPDALREIERLESSELDLVRKAGEQATRDSLEIERLNRALANCKALLAAAEKSGREVCDERDAAATALDVEITRRDHATGRVYSLAERIGFVIAGLREETKRADDAEDKVDRRAREIERLKADLLLLGALKSEEVAPVIGRFREAFGADVPQAPSGKRATAEAERDDARRLVTLERRVGRWMSTEDEEALRRLRQEAREWDGSKVDPPVRHARHDRHCMIGDGVGCSREPGCEVEP